ncbi:MAG: CBS domain-containing protein [Elusimicrobia bacterium]|nr:CBS domain-containing protein [Elusimicrobiota bacterium]
MERERRQWVARDVMSTRVVSVRPSDPIAEVARLLRRRRISAVPVVSRLGHAVGVVSQSDLVRHLGGGEAGDTAQDVMTPWVVSCEEDTPVSELGREMIRKRIHRVLVTRDGRVVGIVSALDLLSAWLGRTRRAGDPPPETAGLDLVRTLEGDHARLRELAERCERWARSPAAQRQERAGRESLRSLLRALARHEEAEMAVLFPAIERHLPGAGALLESMAMAHGLIDRAARRLRCAPATGRAATAGVLEFTARLRSHMEEEERNVFTAARLIPAPVLHELGREARGILVAPSRRARGGTPAE